VFALPPTLPAQEPWSWSDVARIVAVGDVHGAYDELVRLLQATGVIDSSLAWSGGETHLVSLGDLLDRGSGSRAAMDLVRRLQREAPDHGGAVHVVLGNHEVMNLLGDLRYVSAEEYAAYAADESAEVREAAYARFVADQPDILPEVELRSAFERRYPPGYFGHRLAFGPDGEYGSWLLSLPALIRINDVVFVHGGLSEIAAQTPADVLNRQVREHLHRYFSLREQLMDAGVLPPWGEMEDDRDRAQEALRMSGQQPGGDVGPLGGLLQEFLAVQAAPELGLDGPLWYCGAAYCNPFVERQIVEAALASLGAERVVVGHTVTQDRQVRALFDGRVIMLDTGMLGEYAGGRPAALILEGDRTTAQYLSPEERGFPEQGRIEAYGLTETQILQALAQGWIEAASATPRDAAWQPVRVHHDGRVLEAIFRPRDRSRAAEFELAVFHLDALLGLGLVPPTVARNFEERDGTLQLLYPNAINETQRLQDDTPMGEWCSLPPQVDLVLPFDYLIGHRRTSDGVVFRQEFPTVKLIDHAGAFDTGPTPPVPADIALSPALEEALASVDRRALETALREWLDARQIRALLARRDALLAGAASP
jgi:hypothetical protein